MSILEHFSRGPYVRGPECALPAHYLELQALCDALGHAAQLEMGAAIEGGDDLARERAYGKWLGARGILRALEGRTDEWTPTERQMLERIDWSKPQFRFPGLEAFDVPQAEPGQGS
ncbi:MAG TPA: hypothetical protein VGJ60_29580 [Chloroflexota bacterium]